MSDASSATDGAPSATARGLVGRRADLRRIEDARGAGAPGVVLLGPVGVGKSRLARAAVEHARVGGASTTWAQATRSAAAVPLGAFLGLLPADVRSDEPLALLRRGVDAVRESGAGRPVVLGVDDAQLLDPTSAALVLQIALGGAAFVVATVRTGEPVPDAILSLTKDAGAQRVEVGLLDAEETADLAEALVGGPLEQSARRWAWTVSRGNALFVRELVGGAIASGALVEDRELWRLLERPPVAESLADLVRTRTADLDEAGRTVLELLALGEPLRLDELSSLAGEDALLAVEERGLIDTDDAQAVRLAHPLYGEVLASRLGALRGRALRVRLADTVAARPESSPDAALRIARWLSDAGAEVPAALLLDAAQAANLAGDADLGAHFAGLAVEAGAGVEASLLLARAHIVRNRFEEAEAVLAPMDGELDDQDAALRYLEQRAISVLHWGLQRPADAEMLLRRGQAWWPSQEWQRRVDPLRLNLASLMGGFEAAADVSREILADPDLEPEVRRQLEPVHAITLFYCGQGAESEALARRIRPNVPLRDHNDALALIATTINGLESGNDLPELEDFVTRVMEASIRAGDHDASGMAALTLGAIRFLDGSYVDATRWLAEAAVHFEVQDTFGTLIAVRSTQAGVAHGMGDQDALALALERGRALPGWDEPLPSLLPYVVRAEAWSARGDGDDPRAATLLLDGAEQVASMRIYSALLMYEALRAGARASTVAPRLTELAEQCGGRLLAAYAAHANSSAARDGAGVLEAAEAFAAIGTRRYAMEAAAQAAWLFADAGREDSARRATTLARDFHLPEQGGTPPPLEGLGTAGAELTQRERQLVDLARQGLANAEIADRLALSVRTVETHLYRAMHKLGVTDRRDL